MAYYVEISEQHGQIVATQTNADLLPLHTAFSQSAPASTPFLHPGPQTLRSVSLPNLMRRPSLEFYRGAPHLSLGLAILNHHVEMFYEETLDPALMVFCSVDAASPTKGNSKY